MRAALAVEGEVSGQALSSLDHRVIGMQIHFFALGTLPQALEEEVVAPGALVVHAELDTVRLDDIHKCDEYNPSRRRRAPITPGSVQESASRRILRLYSAVNRRWLAFATTSTSGTAGLWTATSCRALMSESFPALYPKHGTEECLTYIGTEGTVSDVQAA
jgi:hypothetical protein